MRACLLLATLLGATIGCAQIDPFAISWGTFQSGTQCDIKTEQHEVINNENDFQTFWMKLTGQSAASTPKGVLWGKEMLIAITLGERPTLGYGVRVVSIDRPSAATTMVRFVEQVPARNPGGQAKSSPWTIVKLNRPGGNIEFAKVGTETIGGGGGGRPRPGGQLNWRTYQTGTDSRIDDPLGRLITTQSELATVWKNLTGDITPPRDVNWEDEVLILVNLGRRGSGGFEVWVEDVRLKPNGLEVRYVERRPSADQRVRREKTNPYVIIRVTPFDGRVTFQGRTWNGGSG